MDKTTERKIKRLLILATKNVDGAHLSVEKEKAISQFVRDIDNLLEKDNINYNIESEIDL